MQAGAQDLAAVAADEDDYSKDVQAEQSSSTCKQS
jgi:hypothetical protein